MRKILLALIFCYSSAFSAYYLSRSYSTGEVFWYKNGNVWDKVEVLYYIGSVSVCAITQDADFVSGNIYFHRTFSSVNSCSSGYSSHAKKYRLLILARSSLPPLICNPDTEVEINSICEVIGEQGSCVSPNIRLANGDCTNCTTEQHWDINQETCINNCIPSFVSNPNPTEWIDLNKISQETCISFLMDREIDGTWLQADNGCGGESIGCFGQPDSPCDNVLSPLLQRPRGGYVYKGRVLNSLICSSYVDGLKYIDSRIRRVDDDCAKNDDYYCYLLPLNADDNETNQDNPFPNQNDDGTVPNDDNISMLLINNDNNFSNPQSLNNQILQDLKNNLQNQNDKINEHNAWFKNKFGKWEPSDFKTDMNYTNNLLEQIVDKPVANINLDTVPITDKLQELIDKNTSIKIDLNETNELLKNILNGDNEGNSSNDSSGIMSYFDTTYTNFETQYNNVKGQIDNVIDVINGKGLSTVLSSNTVNNCPKSFTFDITDTISKNIVIDPCVVLSQSREYMYTFSYIGFSGMYISFLIGMIVRV